MASRATSSRVRFAESGNSAGAPDTSTVTGIPFSVLTSAVDETPYPGESAQDLVQRLATAKAELVAVLKTSFDYCDPVYASMTDAAGAAKVKWARWEMSKLGLLNWNISHDNEMYGIMGAFLRLKGLVPPSSEGRP